MGRTAVLTCLLLAAAVAASTAPRRTAEARAALQCPAVKVSCHDTVGPGEEASFTAVVVGAGATFKPSFVWEVSAGTVSAGQGTPLVKVDTTGLGQPTLVTATVEVGGLSPV